MARYSVDLPITKPYAEIERRIEDYLQGENFKPIDRGGGKYWKKGLGLTLGPQFVKLTKGDGATARLEAWIKFALLPGVYVGEMGIRGAMGAIPKKKLRTRVEEIEKIIRG